MTTTQGDSDYVALKTGWDAEYTIKTNTKGRDTENTIKTSDIASLPGGTSTIDSKPNLIHRDHTIAIFVVPETLSVYFELGRSVKPY